MPVKNCGSTSLTFKQRPFSKFATCSHHAICCSCLGLCAYWISQHRETKRLIFAQWSQKQLVLYPEWIFTTFQWRTNDFVFSVFQYAPIAYAAHADTCANTIILGPLAWTWPVTVESEDHQEEEHHFSLFWLLAGWWTSSRILEISQRPSNKITRR